jgi:DNA replication protein DnaC
LSKQAELAHLFRTLKAQAAARALPKLAERARREEWSYERFAEALLATEVASRDAHGGESRIKQARFPARKTLEEFDFSFQRSVQKTLVLHLGQLDFLTARDNVVLLGPPGAGKTHVAIALGIRACLAGQRVAFATASEWVARLGDAQRQGRLDEELRRLLWTPLLIVDEVGYIPFDAQAANLMFSLVSSRYERASLIVTSNKLLFRLGRDLRGRDRRRRHDRPARAPRRDPLPEGRQLPPPRSRPRRPSTRPRARKWVGSRSPQALAGSQIASQRLDESRRRAESATDPRDRALRRHPSRPREGLREALTGAQQGVSFQPARRGEISTGLDTDLLVSCNVRHSTRIGQ